LEALAIQADGKIVGAGFHSTSMVLVRYTTNGHPDGSFGNNGAVLTRVKAHSVEEKAYAVAIQEDGKIVVAGEVVRLFGHPFGGRRVDSDFAILRYNPNGSSDSAFGDGGNITTDFKEKSIDEARAVAIQADGKIVAVGSTRKNPKLKFAAARYDG
jgi:uncharacterized delta-60 repeat protein